MKDIVKAIESGDFDLANKILADLRIKANSHTLLEKKRIAIIACTQIEALIRSAKSNEKLQKSNAAQVKLKLKLIN